MFNLLPESLKEKIKADYRLRRLTLILIFVLFLEASFFIFLFPSWLISLSREKEIVSETEAMNRSSLSSDTNSLISTIKSTNAKLNIINTALEYPKVVPVLNTILSKKTTGVHINQLTYTTTSAKMAIVSLGGVSSTRESLVAFVKNLERSGLFKAVNLPVSDLAKNKDIVFSLSMTIAP